jgi:hypothetical protein
MDNKKNIPAIQYKTKFAPHKDPVAKINQYCIISNPNGLKKRAIIIQ